MNRLRLCVVLNIIVAIFILNNANATNWYVDKDATGTNNGTSWVNAWASLPSPATGVQAGDTIYISGGITSKTYTTGFPWIPGRDGITIKPGQASPHNGVIIFDGQNRATNAINISATINMVISGNDGSGNRHIKIFNFNGTGISNTGSGNTNVTIEYIEFERLKEAIVMTYATGTTIRFNYMHDIRGNSGGTNAVIRLQNGNTATGYGVVASVHHNEISPNASFGESTYGPYKFGDGADGIEGSWGIDVYNNHIYAARGLINGTVGSRGHMDGVQGEGAYWRIYNNNFENLENSCIEAGGGSHYLIYNNVCAVTDFAQTALNRGFELDTYGAAVTDWHILNNIFSDLLYTAINFSDRTTGAAVSHEIKNNIFYNCGNAILYYAGTGYTSADVDIDYNLIYPPDQPISIDKDPPMTNNYTQTHPRTSKPSFVSYSTKNPTNNFHLASGDTGAKDMGVSLSAYLMTDRDGVTRPQGTAWDIGAYEFVGKVPNVPEPIIIR